MNKKTVKKIVLWIGGLTCFSAATAALAVVNSGLGGIANQVTSNLGSVAKLITAASYVAGMGFAVGSIVKFKAHKDNPTQIPIGMPIALLFVAAALIFIPSVFKSSGATLFGQSGTVAGVSGVTTFGGTKSS
ncbi:MAG: type IV secretion protein IcmD [Pseudomonadota bacterium]|jgi:intracellular multiplication protein IcmD